MEKPRKKELNSFDSSIHPVEVAVWNQCHDAMSAWIGGQVPTEEQTELEIHRYFDKGLKSDKPTNITIEFLARHLHECLKRKLTREGK